MKNYKRIFLLILSMWLSLANAEITTQAIGDLQLNIYHEGGEIYRVSFVSLLPLAEEIRRTSFIGSHTFSSVVDPVFFQSSVFEVENFPVYWMLSNANKGTALDLYTDILAWFMGKDAGSSRLRLRKADIELSFYPEVTDETTKVYTMTPQPRSVIYTDSSYDPVTQFFSAEVYPATQAAIDQIVGLFQMLGTGVITKAPLSEVSGNVMSDLPLDRNWMTAQEINTIGRKLFLLGSE
jgi:hypothetical protein